VQAEKLEQAWEPVQAWGLEQAGEPVQAWELEQAGEPAEVLQALVPVYRKKYRWDKVHTLSDQDRSSLFLHNHPEILDCNIRLNLLLLLGRQHQCPHGMLHGTQHPL